ncbi:uncharacterized protein SEPMUDRAFT_116896 [Sphaerulina musiva SO2202]|uniref:Uncharacterized protein n=1 Tax=Sphaerulina musiva (strain SO2202) TaxID=692275 RepID=M3CJB8_SPHMS|nr:uncharacterized protein SEPMUDRAFT_116896 [Sphaerulina musiva SO2202]EMF13888.1 hypothetical protein SEPMUDRAFT_116896 [Sphaerulina musiva SO2202]
MSRARLSMLQLQLQSSSFVRSNLSTSPGACTGFGTVSLPQELEPTRYVPGWRTVTSPRSDNVVTLTTSQEILPPSFEQDCRSQHVASIESGNLADLAAIVNCPSVTTGEARALIPATNVGKLL